jgi:hypothetical protein
MSNNMKFAVSVALVLGSASGAMAATTHQSHRQPAPVIERQTPRDVYAYGFATGAGAQEPGYMAIQSRGDRENN